MDVRVDMDSRAAEVLIGLMDYGRIGSRSIVGGIAKECNLKYIDTVRILFRRSMRVELERRGGPGTILMPEYVPEYIVSDVLYLIEIGKKVEVSSWPKE